MAVVNNFLAKDSILNRRPITLSQNKVAHFLSKVHYARVGWILDKYAHVLRHMKNRVLVQQTEGGSHSQEDLSLPPMGQRRYCLFCRSRGPKHPRSRADKGVGVHVE